MLTEKKEESLGLKPGPNLREFINENIEKAIKAGRDPEVETFRALIEAGKSGKIDELIRSDIQDVGENTTSS